MADFGDDLANALEDDVDDYIDGSCSECGAGPDEPCKEWCTADGDDDPDDTDDDEDW